jgi:hypothetical protein
VIQPKTDRVRRLLATGLVLALALAFLILRPPAASTHDPITTRITFNKEIVRILGRSCLGCHSERGIASSIPLTTYEQARPWAKAIKEEVLEKRMPPYQVVKGYGHFSQDYILPQRDVEMIVSWVEGGAPKGLEKDLPARANEAAWTLAKPDLVLDTGEIKVATNGEDQTRCVEIATSLSSDQAVRAVDFRTSRPQFLARATIVINRQPRRLLNIVSQRAAECMIDGGEPLADRLLDWVPNETVAQLPPGVVQILPAGSSLVLRIKYKGSEATPMDRCLIGLYFAKQPPAHRQLQGVAIKPAEVKLDPGAQRVRVRATYIPDQAIDAVSIRPLLFPYGTSIEATARRPDGSVEILAWVRNYRWDWQPAYFFRRPISLPRGSRIDVIGYLDNSDRNPNNPSKPPQQAAFSGALCELFYVSSSNQSAAH